PVLLVSFPSSCLPPALPLSALLPYTPLFRSHAVDLSDDRVELVHHPVDDILDLQNLPPDVHRNLLRQVTVGDRRGHLRHVTQLDGQIAGHRIDVIGQVLPRAGDTLDPGLPPELALSPDLARHP